MWHEGLFCRKLGAAEGQLCVQMGSLPSHGLQRGCSMLLSGPKQAARLLLEEIALCLNGCAQLARLV